MDSKQLRDRLRIAASEAAQAARKADAAASALSPGRALSLVTSARESAQRALDAIAACVPAAEKAVFDFAIRAAEESRAKVGAA